MRTELKKMDILLAKGNIPKPESNPPPSDSRRDDYDRDRYDRGGDRNSYRGPRGGGGGGGFRGSSSNYRGRGGPRGPYRH
jgi:hypothetical protein